MRLRQKIKREIRFLKGLSRTLKRVKTIAPDSPNLICDDLEAAVDKWGPRPAITFEGKTITYADLDAMANRYAHWAKGLGLTRGQTVALFMPNRIEYLAIWYGLTKVGVATALINNQLTGAALAHCLTISQAMHCIVDAETSPCFEDVKGQLERHMQQWVLGPVHDDQRDLLKALKSCSQLRPDRETAREGLTASDTALYIYTSGTTGLPKAARITHMRAQLYMRGFAGSTGAKDTDRIYITLPLYHATGGLCALGAALLNGGSVVLRKKFSATHFWPEIVAEQCTMFVYIGELCRYLANQPEHELERAHKLRMIFGNGLRADVWDDMLDRFKVGDVLEFYGATEGNVSFFNFDGKRGAIGRIPSYLRKKFNIRIVKFDVETETPIRGPDGCCIEAGPEEVGECIGHIGSDARSNFTGYADKAATEKKVLHDVFEKGDAWFRTGDLMKVDHDGYIYFIDRIGDTFRWKGENVATSEVAERLAGFEGVLEVNVYGVKVGDLDGKAGMASLVTEGDFDLEAFAKYVDEALPSYARPLFVRLQKAIETTGTFKYRKIDLVNEGFDPSKTKDPLYFRDPAKGYVKITKTICAKIEGGGFRL
ncbi:long-chain-acyl-CoA synthetase [Caulobacter vibrioides]|nr:long-chain-acyl-CoA synthetase [Caulobacter vibrioides]YP_002517757.1 very-long-chain acyl-CoA synthetase [Caulobacter vibrioides NA1000]ACL95849.1 very-long-chain acyl-CoA synthetase [Caulobacter vibrioides NA1000]ATC29162.1 long-chain-acyl-CoA synthetase [Caulobacter vibrioides]QXZ50673.1 long-chain-acyl-CoA synthetase [Caulobacter vibrioides]